MPYNLDRFLKAQNQVYLNAYQEIKQGKKQSHWMWYVFPQIAGLGSSETANYYAISSKEEAAAYLNHPVLGANLRTLSQLLLELPNTSAENIFGSIDALKLRSSMTLFSEVSNQDDVFQNVIEKYFDGQHDHKTFTILRALDN